MELSETHTTIFMQAGKYIALYIVKTALRVYSARRFYLSFCISFDGSAMVKVEPWPIMLVTSIVPL